MIETGTIQANLQALAYSVAGIMAAIVLLAAIWYGTPVAVTLIKRIRKATDGDDQVKKVIHVVFAGLLTLVSLFTIVAMYAFFTSLPGVEKSSSLMGKILATLATIIGL